MRPYKVGMYGGSFNPLHNGHVKCITEALNLCDELHIIIGNIPNMDDFNIEIKMEWFKNVFSEYEDRIVLHSLYDDRHDKSEYTIDKWVADAVRIKEMIGKHIDIVFCGSDYNREDNPYFKCYPGSTVWYFERTDDISSSGFRKNIDKFKDWVPEIVYEYYKNKRSF